MKIRSPKKVLQQRRVLLLALYLLKNRFGVNNPPKRRVLRFIRSERLMNIPTNDESDRSTGEAVWENDLAWKREDLKEQGLLRMPEHGIWQITEYGEREIEAWAQRVKEMTETRPDWVADLKAHLNPDAEFDLDFHCEYYITEDTIRWALKIAAKTLT